MLGSPKHNNINVIIKKYLAKAPSIYLIDPKNVARLPLQDLH